MHTRSLYALLLLLAFAHPAAVLADVAASAPDVAVNVDTPQPAPVLANTTAASESFEFQAQVSRLMHLIINSVYKSRDIFLRELISNASDALDKIRFMSLTAPDALAGHPDLKIQISFNPEAKTLTIRDTGVGMTREELQKNLGTLAKSGTAEFLQAVEQGKADISLIGQFGVGFYSAFLVADKVTVASKSHQQDSQQWIWESEAAGEFRISADPRGNTLGRGTEITLWMKPDAADEFLKESQLKELIGKYSEFINFPIFMWTKKTVEETVEETETVDTDKEEEKKEKKEETDDDDSEDKKKDEKTDEDDDDEEKEEEAKEKKTVTREVTEWTQMNTQKPIWIREPKDVTKTEYEDFYKAYTKDTEAPLAWSHFKAEGDSTFRAIVYVPGKSPFDILAAVRDRSKNVKLFVRRVFITDDLGDDFVPKWMNFVSVLVDADDLPLNVSRETLQHHRALRTIKKKLVSKLLELLTKLAEDEPEKYDTFLGQFGGSLKLGAIEDTHNREKLMKLLRFHSSQSSTKVGLDEYVSRMKKGQKDIYYLTGMSLDEIKASPFVEKLVARGYEVLFLDEPIDEYIMKGVTDFGKHKFQSVAKAGLKFGDEAEEDEKRLNDAKEKFKPLTDWLKETLKDRVEDVVVTDRLTKSPSALVANQYGWSGNMERIMSSQAMQQKEDFMRNFYLQQKKILEVNPWHPLIEGMLRHVRDTEAEKQDAELAQVLFEVTSIRSGYDLKDSAGFARRVERVMRQNLDVDLDLEADVQVRPAPEVGSEELREEAERQVEEVEAGEEEEVVQDIPTEEEAPAVEEPLKEEPLKEEPLKEEPVHEEPAVEKPVKDEAPVKEEAKSQETDHDEL